MFLTQVLVLFLRTSLANLWSNVLRFCNLSPRFGNEVTVKSCNLQFRQRAIRLARYLNLTLDAFLILLISFLGFFSFDFRIDAADISAVMLIFTSLPMPFGRFRLFQTLDDSISGHFLTWPNSAQPETGGYYQNLVSLIDSKIRMQT